MRYFKCRSARHARETVAVNMLLLLLTVAQINKQCLFVDVV